MGQRVQNGGKWVWLSGWLERLGAMWHLGIY